MKQVQGAVAFAIGIALTCQTAANAQQPVIRAPAGNTAPIQTWLNCVECTTAQLAAVAALGDAAVPELAAVLRTGPPQARVDAQRKYLEGQWQRMKDYAARHQGKPLQETQQQYVDVYLQRYVVLHRARAARALGAIKTPTSQNALTQALQLPNLPDALRKEISSALARP